MKRITIIISIVITSFTSLLAQSRWSFEMHVAEVYNVPMPLTISQKAYPEIHLTARYFTDPFTLPFHHDIRVSHWMDGKSWELENIHQKLYLQNTTSEVQKFNISHGFNLFFINRGFEEKSFRYHVGVGFVVTHPESIIRGREFGESSDDNDMGYFLSGPALNLAVNRPFYIGNRFYIDAEVKTTMSYASVKIAQGRADVYNLAFHLLLGVGMDFLHKRQ